MASIDGRNHRRVGAAVLATLGALVLTVACGKPEFTFVANKDENTYFKVPYEWTEIDPRSIDSFVGNTAPGSYNDLLHKQRLWSVAYDAAEDPTSLHMTSAMVTQEPVFYFAIQKLQTAERDEMSLDVMRNFFLPVTDERRKLAADAEVALPGFELIIDEEVQPAPGLHGVRVIYNYQLPSGIPHTFDQSVYVNNDASTLYFLLFRCSFDCYVARKAEIDEVVTSFTVRSQQ
jgi:hypothetical protein